jgi:hypothetical protein
MIFDIKRLTENAGQDFTDPKCRVRSPHITARESIEIGDYIVAMQKRLEEFERAEWEKKREYEACEDRSIKLIELRDKRICELEAFIRRYRYNIKQNEGDGTQRTISKLLNDPTPNMSKPKYVILGDHTHFTYNEDTQEVSCTHGGWSGYLVIDYNKDSQCYVKLESNERIEYDSYVFTDADSVYESLSRGLIK